jgi:molybdopterin-binding protein
MAISARNNLKGEILDIKLGDVVAQVTISVEAGTVESIITRQAVLDMNLKKGDSVSAVVKATEVMISKQ